MLVVLSAIFVAVGSRTPTAQVPSRSSNPPAAAPGLDAMPDGTTVAGGNATPITWAAHTTSSAVVTPMAGGVQLTLTNPAHHEFVPVPDGSARTNMRIDADVSITAGPQSNRIGVGCSSADGSQLYAMVLTGPRWELDEGTRLSGLDAGAAAINSQSPGNHVAALCAAGSAGMPRLMFAINGTVVSEMSVAGATARPWLPVIVLCSCGGTDTATYTSIIEKAVSSAP